MRTQKGERESQKEKLQEIDVSFPLNAYIYALVCFVIPWMGRGYVQTCGHKNSWWNKEIPGHE